MEDEGESSQQPLPQAVVVEYDPITGIPSEFNEYLPKDSQEYQKLQAAQNQSEGGGEPDLSKLAIDDKAAKKGKKKASMPEILIETQTRSKKKHVTTVIGLDAFGVKLGDAAKLFGKKFACGASVTKNASEKEQIEIQGDVIEGLVDLLLKQYGAQNGIEQKHIYFMNNKKKEAYFS